MSRFNSSYSRHPLRCINKENQPPCFQLPKATPRITKEVKVDVLKKNFQKNLQKLTTKCEENTSPSLTKLRNLPEEDGVKVKQQVLLEKHHQAKSQIDNLSVGGGFSIWPNMDDMRLSQSEIKQLIGLSCILILTVVFIFFQIHGNVLKKIKRIEEVLNVFHSDHPLVIDSNIDVFERSIMTWHEDYKELLEDIHLNFDVSLPSTPLRYKMCVFLYCCGVLILLYFLIESMSAKSKLTPKKVKQWVSLLVIISTWTILILKMLVLAQSIEHGVENNVYLLNEELGRLVQANLDLKQFNYVLQYWHTRHLLPSSPGTLSIMGVIPVKDVMYYLQYYSVPVITALVTPIIRLILALRSIYCKNQSA